MDIQRAKEEIKRSVQAYLATDDIGRAADTAHPPAPHSADGPAGRRQDPDHGADCAGVRHCAGGLYHHPPHPAERRGPALHPGAGFMAGKTRSVTEYTMSEIIASVYAAMERTGKTERHPVHRRDQLRQRDAGPHDAAIFAVQDLRQPGRAGRLGHRGGGQPAGVQQERAGI